MEVGVIDQMPIWPFCLGETLDNVSKVMSPQCRCGFPGSQVANAVWLRRLPACLHGRLTSQMALLSYGGDSESYRGHLKLSLGRDVPEEGKEHGAFCFPCVLSRWEKRKSR